MSSGLNSEEVVVIGGPSGIGLATATMAQEAGARVTVVGTTLTVDGGSSLV